jgi:hypothetical protein
MQRLYLFCLLRARIQAVKSDSPPAKTGPIVMHSLASHHEDMSKNGGIAPPFLTASLPGRFSSEEKAPGSRLIG